MNDEEETIIKHPNVTVLDDPFKTLLTDKKLFEISKLHNVTLIRGGKPLYPEEDILEDMMEDQDD